MNELIQPNSKVEVIVIKNGKVETKRVRVMNAVKKYIFESMIRSRYALIQYEVL